MTKLKTTMARLVLTLTVAMAGCRSLLDDPPHWDVELSSLDAIQFLSSPEPTTTKPEPVTVQLELTGTGLLAVDIGRSERVVSGFWGERKGPHWDDLRSDRLVLSRVRTQGYFQRLVDMGYFEYRFPEVKAGAVPGDTLVVLGNINKRKKLRVTADPRVRALFNDLLGEF